ncbi:type 4a pilus biogenesis protein PilO [Pseudomonas sp. Fl5BN2]|uniref:type 4a pilus biogenesis protein PilO n=1 Tax=Pseudomonas sp. Fl5BN2 TaxID=2697652 RepID=UPI0013774836|nr:type 4a pilus biogenesis protein PilO [Pseudomonas sp. Fl5BN2]NBF01876.1 type 4a pilus biogenesis protein PilO [Pseudomonas sp. Fl5BN2]
MSVGRWLVELRRSDLRALDLGNLGSWPALIKTLVAVLLLLLVLVSGYSLYLASRLEQLDRQRQEEIRFKQQFADKARQGANLERYREQLEAIQNSFELLLRQLPNDAEVPGLLEDISRVGLGSGLAFEEIKLQSEVARLFYVELPIQITVTGAYHDLATFVSGVAGLPRIVTLHDFQIKPVEAGNPERLRMSIEARTYRYDRLEPQS